MPSGRGVAVGHVDNFRKSRVYERGAKDSEGRTPKQRKNGNLGIHGQKSPRRVSLRLGAFLTQEP